MRFLFRLAVLALAAFGAKTLYDRYAPKAAELRGSAGGVLGSAKEAAQGVGQHAKEAANDVADDARQRAGAVREQAADAAGQMQDEAPTVANAASASGS
jgi:hypothetical protein